MKDPLAAATRSIIRPFLQSEGFVHRSRRDFVRIEDCVAQIVNLQVTGWGGGDFCVNYAATAICFPFEAWTLSHGGRLSNSDGREQWWPASNGTLAEVAAGGVVAVFQRTARQFLQSCRDAAGLIGVIRSKERMQHHDYFECACCEAWIGRLEEASTSLERAIEQYTEDYQESRGTDYARTWCIGYKRAALRLRRAIDRGDHQQVLDSFFRWRWKHLRLNGLCKCPR